MIRKYKSTDYVDCLSIVSAVWNFDDALKNKKLSKLFTHITLKLHLSNSNYATVIEEDNTVQGFLFANCGKENFVKNEYSGKLRQLRLAIDLLKVKDYPIKKKWEFLKLFSSHDKSRDKVLKKTDEINLFAVSANTQGKGYGKKLMNAFISHCKKQNIEYVALETDEGCNYKFYDHYGFKQVSTFYSPLQKKLSGISGTCFVYKMEIKGNIAT